MAMRLWRGSAESQLQRADMLKLFVLGFVGIFGFNYSFFTALQTTSTLNAALIMALSPLLTALLATQILGSVLQTRQILGIVIAFIGVTLVITGGHLSALHVAVGDWWMLLASFSWSLYSVLLQKLTAHIPPLQQARWTVTAGAAGLIAVAMAREPITTLGTQTPTTMAIVIYMALCGTVLAYIFWLRGVQALGPQRAMIAFNLVPVSTLLVNLAFGQWPSVIQIGGLLTVIVGVAIASGWHPDDGWTTCAASLSPQLTFTTIEIIARLIWLTLYGKTVRKSAPIAPTRARRVAHEPCALTAYRCTFSTSSSTRPD